VLLLALCETRRPRSRAAAVHRFTWGDPGAVDEVISRFRNTTEAGDIDGFMALIHPEAELVSPIFGRLVIRGERDLRTLFTAVYGSLKGLTWIDQVTGDRLALLRGEARIGPARLDDAMVLELGPDGRIRRIRPHFRPLLGITMFARRGKACPPPRSVRAVRASAVVRPGRLCQGSATRQPGRRRRR
jgi:hypothetical protein